MALTPEEIYRRLGTLIGEIPPAPLRGPPNDEFYRWTGRVDAVLLESGDISDRMDWRIALGAIAGGPSAAFSQMRSVLFRAFARAELAVSPALRGAFIPVGGQFDAYASVARIFSAAEKELFVVDPYLDGVAFSEFFTACREGVAMRLLTDKAYADSLIVAAKRWRAQYNTLRPVEVRIAQEKSLHDRLAIVDNKDVWILTQSLKDFAKRSPGSINPAVDTGTLKIPAYADIWDRATVATI